MFKILIVEDEKIIANSIKEQLEQWEYEVKLVEDFKLVNEIFDEYQPELVLLDIGLPFFNGYHWCSEIRKKSAVPIIFLSSASDNMNVVMAISMGGDDFVAKPFSLEVLTAKVQALLRRTYSMSGTVNIIEHKEVILDLNETALKYKGQRLELTKNDFRILQILMENKGTVVSREKIMERLWQSEAFIDDNTLTVNMTRLRKKLEVIGLPEFVKTKKGMGYLVD
ncbi:MAG: response regulator transcription factor [Anaerovoracaceae bacterium]